MIKNSNCALNPLPALQTIYTIYISFHIEILINGLPNQGLYEFNERLLKS